MASVNSITLAQSSSELEQEQSYIDYAFDCLESSRKKVMDLRQSPDSGTHQARYEREVMDDEVNRRLAKLELGDRSLCFGRLDFEDDFANEDDLGSMYIGRIGVWNSNRNPVVVDWRVPAAEPFYRATGVDSMGLVRRRHFACLGRKLLRMEDEYFGDLPNTQAANQAANQATEQAPNQATTPQITDSAGRAIRGLGTVRQFLSESRSGRLSEIVATIQAEQDEVIRSELRGVLVVQGGPGTGKTVVALHRAAYLLYTHRFPLERQGVVIAVPNRVFAQYIELVLPSLGEAGAVVATPAQMLGLDSVSVEGCDPEELARLKGETRMATLIARAAKDRFRPLRRDFTISYRPEFRFTVGQSKELVAQVHRRKLNHQAGRKLIEAEFYKTLSSQIQGADFLEDEDDTPLVALKREIGDTQEVRQALEWMCPRLSPQQLLIDLFSTPSLLRSAGRNLLTDREIELLSIPGNVNYTSSKVWSMEDVPLLDEAQMRLGTPQPLRTYGHIVVDEAQDVSPMLLRMYARRSLNGSMTLVGDIAQATSPASMASWEELLSKLPDKWQKRTAELSVGYRLPKPIVSFVQDVLADGARESDWSSAELSHNRLPVAVQTEGNAPEIEEVPPEQLYTRVAEVLTRNVTKNNVNKNTVNAETIAVIVPDEYFEECLQHLTQAGFDCATPYGGALSKTVSVLPVRFIKGLEVDVGIVVQPSKIQEQSSRGQQNLYVALTRAMRHLVVVKTN